VPPVEQHAARVAIAARQTPARLHDRMLTAGEAREGGRHGDIGEDSMLGFVRTMKARLIKRFEDEIAVLERELTHELPKEIKRARELGDLRENAEYHAAKERQRFVETRISMLRTRVSQIQLMNLERIPHDKAGFGSKLTVVEHDKTFVYELVMPEDANPDMGLISVASPLGRAFAGKEEGDDVSAPTPAGVRRFEIVKLVTIHDDQ
jgi:transcription elongation factor GreA